MATEPRYCRFKFYCRCGVTEKGVKEVREAYAIREAFEKTHLGHQWGELIENVRPPR